MFGTTYFVVDDVSFSFLFCKKISIKFNENINKILKDYQIIRENTIAIIWFILKKKHCV